MINYAHMLKSNPYRHAGGNHKNYSNDIILTTKKKSVWARQLSLISNAC